MDDVIRVLLLKDGRVIVTKLEEVADHDIGEPDCVMIDPVLYDSSAEDYKDGLTRYPGVSITSDTKMAIGSDNILTMVTPTTALLAEYLVTIGD